MDNFLKQCRILDVIFLVAFIGIFLLTVFDYGSLNDRIRHLETELLWQNEVNISLIHKIERLQGTRK
jgi:hypothetical protein